MPLYLSWRILKFTFINLSQNDDPSHLTMGELNGIIDIIIKSTFLKIQSDPIQSRRQNSWNN